MKAFLIDPVAADLEAVDVGSLDDVRELVGYDDLESDEVEGSDRLYFDESCFIRGAPGKFRVDSLIPVAGRGVIVGCAEDGETLLDATLTLEALRARVAFS